MGATPPTRILRSDPEGFLTLVTGLPEKQDEFGGSRVPHLKVKSRRWRAVLFIRSAGYAAR